MTFSHLTAYTLDVNPGEGHAPVKLAGEIGLDCFFFQQLVLGKGNCVYTVFPSEI